MAAEAKGPVTVTGPAGLGAEIRFTTLVVAGGELDRATVEEQLMQVALGIGLRPAEIARTIASGLRRGEQLPRVAPHRLEPLAWERHRSIAHDLPGDAPAIGSDP